MLLGSPSKWGDEATAKAGAQGLLLWLMTLIFNIPIHTTTSSQSMEKFGLSHPSHRRVSWPDDLFNCSINLPSSVIQLLINNNPISLHQRELILGQKNATTQKMEANSIKIQQLEKKLEQMKQMDQGFQKQLYAYDTILSPFRRLSNDILYHISTHLPPIEYSDICSIASHSAYAVSQVSQSWRQTVHSVSTLWTTIQVDCSHWYSKPIKSLIDRVEHYSLLSASKPLTIQVDSSSGNNAELKDTDAIVRMLTWMFTSWLSRNRVSRFCIRESIQLLHCLKKLGEAGYTLSNVESYLVLPSMTEEVTRRSGMSWHVVDEHDFTTLSCTFPKLHNIWLGPRDYLLGDPLVFEQPHNTEANHLYLQSLYIRGRIEYEDFIGFLCQCPNLEVAWFETSHGGIGGNILNIAPSQPLVHRNMKELVLGIRYFEHHILRLFTNVKFPCLTNLQLHFIEEYIFAASNDDIPNETDFADTFPALKTLYLRDLQNMQDGSLSNIFGFYPSIQSVTHLVFDGMTMDEELGEVFDCTLGLSSSTSQLALPQLQLLEVIYLTGARGVAEITSSNLEDVIVESLSRTDGHLATVQVRLKIHALPRSLTTSNTVSIQTLTAWAERVKNNPGLVGNTILHSYIDVNIASLDDIIQTEGSKMFEKDFMARFF